MREHLFWWLVRRVPYRVALVLLWPFGRWRWRRWRLWLCWSCGGTGYWPFSGPQGAGWQPCACPHGQRWLRDSMGAGGRT